MAGACNDVASKTAINAAPRTVKKDWRTDAVVRPCDWTAVSSSSQSDTKTWRLRIEFPQLLEWLTTSTIHPAVYQSEFKSLTDSFGKRPTLTARVGNVTKDIAETVTEGLASVGGWISRIGM